MEDIEAKKNQLNQDLNIARSKKINAARLEKMNERNICNQDIYHNIITIDHEERILTSV